MNLLDDIEPQWEIEPEPTIATRSDVKDIYAEGVGTGMQLERQRSNPITEILPDGFNLQAILTFLPDVTLKHQLAAQAQAATAVAVTGQAGIDAADAALAKIRETIKDIKLRFDGTEENPGPTALANALHKRLTGLRADFILAGEQAVTLVGPKIVTETRRLAQVAEQERREAQAKADEQARQQAARAAEEAAQAQVEPAIVNALQQAAKSAVAPPVPARPAPRTSSGTVTEKWRARLKGDTSGDQPESPAQMTTEQQDAFLILVRAILAGEAPMAAIRLDWSYLNGRAGGDKASFDIPGLEAYDAGGFRGKGVRK